MMRTIAIIGTDIHGPEDWWPTHNPEENPWLDGGRLRFDRSHWPSMENQYYELAVLAEIDAIAVGLRGTRDPGWEHGAVFASAIRSSTFASSRPCVMPFIDTGALSDVVNYDREGLPPVPFDLAKDDHAEAFWRFFLIPYFQVFAEGVGANPIRWERTPDGRVLIHVWGIEPLTGHGIVNQAHAQRMLDHVARRMGEAGFGTPAFIVDKSWIERAQQLRVYGVHGWFDPSRQDAKGRLQSAVDRAHSIRTHNGITVGQMVPAFFDPPWASQPWRCIPRDDGRTCRDVLARMRQAHADYVFIESYNNRTEGAGLYRTDAWGDRELVTVRDHIRQTKGEDMNAITQEPLLKWVGEAVLMPGKHEGTYAIRGRLEGAAFVPDARAVDAEGRPTLFSLQPNGTVQLRSLGDPAFGDRPREWESGKVRGEQLVFVTENAVMIFGFKRDL